MLGEPFAGVEFTIRALRNNGKRVIYVSNNSVRTMADYRGKLDKLTDYTIDEEDIIHPAKIVIHYLRQRNFDGLCYVIGSSNFKACLREAGFQILDGVSHRWVQTLLLVDVCFCNDSHVFTFAGV